MIWRAFRTVLMLPLLLAVSASAASPQAEVAAVGQVMASTTEFRALLIALLALVGLIVVPLISLLGYIVVRFTSASAATAGAIAANNVTLARIESQLGRALDQSR